MTTAGQQVNFGEDEFYSGGNFDVPEGDYCITFDALNHAFTRADGKQGLPGLFIRLTLVPIDRDGAVLGATVESFLRMGSKAHLSFAPDPDSAGADGKAKSLLAIPGAPAGSMGRDSNWDVFRKSMRNAGLDAGIFTNDLTVLDGLWAHIRSVPEPEERKSFGKSKSGAVMREGAEQEEETRSGGLIPTVTEIFGAPWDGAGGVVEGLEEAEAPAPVKAAPAKPVARAATPAARPVARVPVTPAARPAPPAARRAAAAPPAEAEEQADPALAMATEILSDAKNANGVKKIFLKTQVFGKVKKGYGDDAAQAAVENHFGSDDAVNALIGALGFIVKGADIVPNV